MSKKENIKNIKVFTVNLIYNQTVKTKKGKDFIYEKQGHSIW